MDDNQKKIQDLIESGKSLVGPSIGGTIGGLMGFMVAGPFGAVTGSVVSNVLSDMVNRALSEMEECRVGATAYFAISKIKEELEKGRKLRSDNFFDKRSGRSAAEQIFEGVLFKVKNEHEEKKAKYIANIFANTALREDVPLSEANFLLKLVESLTYQQLCLLAFFNNKFTGLRNANYSVAERVSYEVHVLLLELMDLYNKGLIGCKDDKNEGNVALLGCSDICPNRIFLTGIGAKYCEVMGISEVSKDEIIDVVKFLAK